jgi:hypothetical protein
VNFDETGFHGYNACLAGTRVLVGAAHRQEAYRTVSSNRQHVTLLSCVGITDKKLDNNDQRRLPAGLQRAYDERRACDYGFADEEDLPALQCFGSELILTGPQEQARQAHVELERAKKASMSEYISQMKAEERAHVKEERERKKGRLKNLEVEMKSLQGGEDDGILYPFCHCKTKRPGFHMIKCTINLPDCPGRGQYHKKCICFDGDEWSCRFCSACNPHIN